MFRWTTTVRSQVAKVRAWDTQTSECGWRLPIEQLGVTRCVVDHAFALEFHDGEQRAVVRIEGIFAILVHGRVHRLTPSAPTELGPALGLFAQVIRSATASARGELEIAFEDSRVLSV